MFKTCAHPVYKFCTLARPPKNKVRRPVRQQFHVQHKEKECKKGVHQPQSHPLSLLIEPSQSVSQNHLPQNRLIA